jgi:hypothetical protein
MTVITMSRTEIDRMRVLHDLADGRIKVAEASTLMGLGRRRWYDPVRRHKRTRANANSTTSAVPHYNCRDFTAHWLVGSPGMICRSGSGPIEI